jgi:hypothetical protein
MQLHNDIGMTKREAKGWQALDFHKPMPFPEVEMQHYALTNPCTSHAPVSGRVTKATSGEACED